MKGVCMRLLDLVVYAAVKIPIHHCKPFARGRYIRRSEDSDSWLDTTYILQLHRSATR